MPFVAMISTSVQRLCSTCHANEERLRAPACRATPAAPAAPASALIVRQITGPAVGELCCYLQLQLHIVCNFAGLRRHVTVSYSRPVCLLISTTMVHQRWTASVLWGRLPNILVGNLFTLFHTHSTLK